MEVVLRSTFVLSLLALAGMLLACQDGGGPSDSGELVVTHDRFKSTEYAVSNGGRIAVIKDASNSVCYAVFINHEGVTLIDTATTCPEDSQ